MEQSSINVFERISAEYYNLTTAEKKAADYVLSHQRKAQDMSITELAAASGVAEATVSRFCRRLGCKGYNAFRLAIANSIAQRPQQSNPLSGEVLDDDSFSDVCKKLYTANVSAMTQTLELVRPEEYIRAADLLEQADRVLCMGQGGSMIIAMEAAHLFSTASGKFFSVTDSHMQAIAIATAGENDVILFFSYSGATKDLIETLSYARERGLRSILEETMQGVMFDLPSREDVSKCFITEDVIQKRCDPILVCAKRPKLNAGELTVTDGATPA